MPRNDGINERLLESENNRLSDKLAGKISQLKAISIEMKVILCQIICAYKYYGCMRSYEILVLNTHS